MNDISIRKVGRTGRITFTRPQALNALTHDMALAIDEAFGAWRNDDDVAMVVIDAEGERAFCAGGDVADVYHKGLAQDYAFGQQFFREEYRMNARIFNFPKPVAAFMQGFTMGGGVGIGGHGSHRVVGDSTKIAMPETGIGLIPDVGGSLLLARAPGRLGEYLGVTGARMSAGDAIFADFADYYLPEALWPALIAQLEETGDWELIDAAAHADPVSPLAEMMPAINASFGGETMADILRSLEVLDSDFTTATQKSITRNSPLSMAATIELIHRVRARDTIGFALAQEFRYTFRAQQMSDFQEGVRAQIIDKDRAPAWKHDSALSVSMAEVSNLLMPLGADELKAEE